MPVLAGEQLIACVNMNWIDSAVDLQTIVARHLSSLQAAAREIGLGYAAAFDPTGLSRPS